ncbi:MAG: nuclear transport factor 2 family protein [Acidimicrobiales bacterium]
MTGDRSPVDVVLSFLACGERRDFSLARELLDENITRTGPHGDVKSGRDEYLAYLESVLGDAKGYRYELGRSVASQDGRTVLVEIAESLTQADGVELNVREAMIFDITPAGLIGRLSVYGTSTPEPTGYEAAPGALYVR